MSQSNSKALSSIVAETKVGGMTVREIIIPRKAEQLSTNGKQQSGSPLQEFHLFPKLPIELRVMIWQMLSPEPRVVKAETGTRSIRGWLRIEIGISCNALSPCPVLLRTCHESRTAQLSLEERMNATATMFNFPMQPGPCRFDSGNDVLSMLQSKTLQDFCDTSRSKTRETLYTHKTEFLLKVQHINIVYFGHQGFQGIVDGFPNIKTVTIGQDADSGRGTLEETLWQISATCSLHMAWKNTRGEAAIVPRLYFVDRRKLRTMAQTGRDWFYMTLGG